ncbi:hypothetical protein PQX77_015155 [Marasmius sp. AFHP31]|nr:hypothetical protein PQX77_015155 [Marasmius sp. AFHP31]
MSYAKLWITPQGEPLSVDAAVSFMKYLSNEELQFNTAVELYGAANSKINGVSVFRLCL